MDWTVSIYLGPKNLAIFRAPRWHISPLISLFYINFIVAIPVFFEIKE
jgi:hypothetical protein